MSKPIIIENKKGEKKMRVYVKSRKMAWTSKVINEFLTDSYITTPTKDSKNNNA